MTFSLMGRPAGHFLSTLMKAEILHPAAFLVKHFSEKKMPKLLPNFTQGRLAHISNTEKNINLMNLFLTFPTVKSGVTFLN